MAENDDSRGGLIRGLKVFTVGTLAAPLTLFSGAGGDGNNKSATSDGLLAGLARMGSGIAVMISAALVVAIALGVPVVGGIFGDLNTAAILFGAVVASYYVTATSGEVSFAFTVTSVAVLLLLAEFVLPGWVVSAVPPFWEWVGFQAGAIDPVRFAVTAVIAVLASWAFSIRVWGRAKKPDTIAKRMNTRAQRLVDTYLTIGRVVAAFGIAVVGLFLAQGGELAGELGAWMGAEPGFSAAIINAIVGILALGGPVPILEQLPLFGDIAWGGYAVVVFVVIVVAAAVKYQ